MRKLGVVMACGVAAVALAGCRTGEKKRSTVEFHTSGVRLQLDRVLRQVPKTNDAYSMWDATGALKSAVEGLPGRVEQQAADKKAERLAAAQQAVQRFAQLKPVLDSMRYDQAKVIGQLEELRKLLDQVDQQS